MKRFFEKHNPDGDDEADLVQSLADTEWRLLRIPALEMGIYAVGRLEFAEKFAAEPDEINRAALIDAQVFLACQRQLNNLSIQERRLRSQRNADLKELKSLQSDRRHATERQVAKCVTLYKETQKEGKPFDPAEFGFEISMQQVRERIVSDEARYRGDDPDLAILKLRKLPKAA